ncbi:MAG: YfhO family protein [Alphaproteobacteria bacterium]
MARTEPGGRTDVPEGPRWPSVGETCRAGALLAVLVALFLWPVFTGRALTQTGALREMSPWRGEVAAPSSPLPGTRSVNRVLDDQSREFLPFFLVARESILRGELPLWNPTIFTGTPLLADAQSAVLFPLNAGHYLLPPPWGFTASAFAKLLLAGLAAWILGRRLGQSFPAAAVSGIAWAFCSFQVFWLSHPHTNATAIFPLLLAMAEEVVDRPGSRARVALAVLVALQLLGGHVEIAFLEAVAGAAWAAIRSVQSRRSPGRAITTWVGAHLLGAAMGAVVLFPFVELLLESATWKIRSAENPFFLPPLAWTALVSPGLFAEPGWGAGPNLLHALAPSTGLAGLLLAAVALLARPGGARLAPGALAALGWAIASGPGPVGAILLRLPLFRQNPNYYAVLFPLLAISMLAGFGLDDLSAPGSSFAHRVRRSLSVASATLALVLLALAAGGSRMLEPSLAALGAEAPATVAASIAGAARGSLAVVAVAWIASATLAAKASPSTSRARAALAALVFAELWVAGSGWNPWVRADEALPPRPEVLAPIRSADGAPPRIAATADVLPPGTGVFAGLHDVRGYDVPVLAAYHEWFGRALGGRDTYWVYELPEIRPESRPFLDAAAVSWTIEPGVGAGEGGRVSVKPSPGAFPRAWFVALAEPAAGATAALDRVIALGQGLRERVVVEGEPGLASPGPAASRDGEVAAPDRPLAARVARHEARRVDVEVEAPEAGWLVLADAWHAGWSATVDGVDAPVRRANALFRAVRVGPGRHRVRFSYDPASVRLGLVAGLAAFGYGASRWLRRR